MVPERMFLFQSVTQKRGIIFQLRDDSVILRVMFQRSGRTYLPKKSLITHSLPPAPTQRAQILK